MESTQQPTVKKKNTGKIVLITLGALFVLGTIGKQIDKNGTGVGSGAPRQSPFDNSVDVVEYYIKHNYLRDPDSYESIRWSKLEKNADGTFQVTHQFRARNGFGGMDADVKTFTISADGNKVIAVN